MSDDRRLLREYVQTGSRKALEELVQRYLRLVYSSALRQVRDPNLAEDVTQAAFLVFTQKARTIRDGVAVGGWLLSVTRCVVVTWMRKQAIKDRHEQLAARPEVLESAAADEWEEIAPLLDGELNRLRRVDRDAVVLRFFQDRSFAEIGVELGFSEEAARKRVGRALERLRARLSGQGASLGTGALGLAVGTYAMQTAPSHLAAVVMAASVGSAVPHCLGLAKGAIDLIAWTKAKLVGAVAASILMGGTGAVVVTQSIEHQERGQTAASPLPAAPARAPVMARKPAPAAEHALAMPPQPAVVAVEQSVIVSLPASAAPAAAPQPAASAAPPAPSAPAGPNGRRGNETISRVADGAIS